MDEVNFIEKKQTILDIIDNEKYLPMTSKELAFLMGLGHEQKNILEQIINELESDFLIFKSKKGKLLSFKSSQFFVGRFEDSGKNFGFVVDQNDSNNKIFIPPGAIYNAFHNDIVACKIFPKDSEDSVKKCEGIIKKVLKREHDTIVGTYVVAKKEEYVVPDNRKISHYIRINKKKQFSPKNGDKVIIKLEDSLQPKQEILKDKFFQFYGSIIEILGNKHDAGVDILSIINQYNLSYKFLDEVDLESNDIKKYVDELDIKDRVDLREIKTVTIDGADTKDIDDAITICMLPNKNFKLGVHIADVSYYVKEGSAIDAEAYKRSSSVYLVDRVIPMLPKDLSNGICSLNKNVDRLALSCEMEINAKGEVLDHKIFESVIRVDDKVTYEDLNQILCDLDLNLKEKYSDYLQMFEHMDNLRKILRNKRILRGALEFDFKESKIILDENSNPIDIKIYERNNATQIIEEFMIVCNETVAERFFWMEIPFIYRIHEKPDETKINTLKSFIKNFGLNLKGAASHPKSMQDILSKISDTNEEHTISKIILRSLKQAKYSHQNIGHYGLSSKYYCHFTSPIRRYSDLQIHRIIKSTIKDEKILEDSTKYDNLVKDVSARCSKLERVIEDAENEIKSLKKAEFMLDKINNLFEAIISSVSSWGFYVMLNNTVEGVVLITNEKTQQYQYDEKTMTLTEKSTKVAYSLGNTIIVKLDKVDLIQRKIYFSVPKV